MSVSKKTKPGSHLRSVKKSPLVSLHYNVILVYTDVDQRVAFLSDFRFQESVIEYMIIYLAKGRDMFRVLGLLYF